MYLDLKLLMSCRPCFQIHGAVYIIVTAKQGYVAYLSLKENIKISCTSVQLARYNYEKA